MKIPRIKKQNIEIFRNNHNSVPENGMNEGE